MSESRESAVFSSIEPIDKSAELIRQYREDCEIRGMSPESMRRYISSLKIYNQYLQDHNIDLLNVERNVLRSFLEYLRKERNVGLKTIGNYFTSMAMFYEFLEYEGYADGIQFIYQFYIGCQGQSNHYIVSEDRYQAQRTHNPRC